MTLFSNAAGIAPSGAPGIRRAISFLLVFTALKKENVLCNAHSGRTLGTFELVC
jgi:hypothetical protein